MSKKMYLKNGGFGSLKEISTKLWIEMRKEIDRNGESDLTLILESSVKGIEDIIRLNKVGD